MTRTKHLDVIRTECFGIEFDNIETRYECNCIEIRFDGTDIINNNTQMVDTIKKATIFVITLFIQTEMCIEIEFELCDVIGIIYGMKEHVVMHKQDTVLSQTAGEDLCSSFLYHRDGDVSICFDIITSLRFLFFLIFSIYMLEQSITSQHKILYRQNSSQFCGYSL